MESTVNVPPDSTNDKLENVTPKTPDKTCTDLHHNNNSIPTSSTVCKSSTYHGVYLPDDDGSILTPEHAFVQYQTRSEDQACQICGQPAVGFHHRAYVCEACKKFFMRHTAARLRNSEMGSTVTESICPMGGRCRVEGPGRGKCPHCRYRKCLDLGMTLTPPGGEAGCDISQIPCRVCSGPSSGFHFGALTCEGCKGFFRRTVLSNVRLECLGNNDCPITPANRNMCKSCRFQRCLAVGMSKTGSRIGRQPNAIKYYCAREISQLTNSSDCEATTNPSSSSNRIDTTTRRNSISHSSTSSSNTTLSSNISSHNNNNNNSNNNNSTNNTTNHDHNNNNNNNSNHCSTISEHDLSSMNDERCKSGISQSHYPTSSWPSAKRIISNSDRIGSSISSTVSATGTSIVSSSMPRTTTTTTTGMNPFSVHGHNYAESHGGSSTTLKNGSMPCSSPSSSSSPQAGLKNHIKFKTESRAQYPNPQSRLHHPQPSPSQNSCCSNSNSSISSSTTTTSNGAVLLPPGHCNSLLPTSSSVYSTTSSASSTTNGGADYLLNECSRNIKRRKTLSSSMGSEMNESKITSSKFTPVNSTYIHDNEDYDDVDDEGCNTMGPNDSEHLDHRYRQRHQPSTPHPSHPPTPASAPSHHHHHPHHRQHTEVISPTDEHLYGVINSTGTTGCGDAISSSSNTSDVVCGGYDKINDVKININNNNNISVDNFSFIDRSRHLLNQIKLPNDNNHNSNNSNTNNNNADRSVLQHLQFRSCSLVDRSSPLGGETSSLNNPHAVSTHLSQPYLRPTQLCLSTARHIPEDASYSLPYLSSSSSSITSCPRSSVISDYSDFNQQTSTVDSSNSNSNNNNNISDQIWLPKHRYIKSSRSLPNEHTIQPILSNNGSNTNNNNCLDTNPLAFLNGRNSDSIGLSESEPTSTTTPWFAAAAAAVAVVMAASQSPSTNQALDPYTVSCSVNEHFALNDNNINLNQTDLHNSRRVPLNVTNFSKQRFKMGLHETLLLLLLLNKAQVSGSMMKVGGKCEAPDPLRSLHSTPSSLSDVTHPSTMAAMQAAAVAAAAAATAAGLVLSNSRVRGLSDDVYPSGLNRASIVNSFPELPSSCSYASSTSSPSPPIIGNFGRIIENLAIYSSSSDRHSMPSSNLDYPPVSSSSSSSSGVNNYPMNNSLGNTVVPSVTLPGICSKEVGPRLKNGTRPSSITVQQFAERIHTAAKYMVSERKNIRNNLPQPVRPMHMSDRVEDIWNQMMKHFETHSRFIVQFVKYIPGFCYLKISDQRQLVRSAMYPIMLLELSRDYMNEDGSRYNYFDFTPEEHDVILSHFPTFHTISGHLIRSGEFLNRIRLDNIELTLVCAQEVFKNRQGLDDPLTPAHLYNLAGQVLADHIVSMGHSLEERRAALSHISPMLEELNAEHHEVLAQLRQDKPHLDFPQLYLEMFQLTEDEQREQKLNNYDDSDIN
ncbi:unnamed protein product [Trichobilharzia szidati]|nr:unnamed protein product [Trichobilharzia szidati]